MQIIPTKPIPNQTFNVTVGGQNCTLHIYQKAFGLFMDVSVANELIIGGVICENLNRIVRSAYLGFIGDFVFIDNQGSSDPVYTGLGSRYSLAYVTPADISSNLITPVPSSTFIIPPSFAEPTPTTLEAILLSNNTFQATGGAPAGTIVGALSVTTEGPPFSGSITVSGTNGSDFAVENGNLVLSGSLGVGTYSIVLNASQAGAVNTPLMMAEQIVGAGEAYQITGVSLSQNTFTGASGSGTIVGAIVVDTVGGSFGGSISLSGANSADFSIDGSNNLILASTLVHGTYNINIVATDVTAIGSPFTQPETITGQLTLTGITLSNGTFTASGTVGTFIGNISVQTTGGSFSGNLTLSGANSGLFSVTGSGALVLNSGSVGAGVYSIQITATMSGAGVVDSPFTKTVTLQGLAPTVTLDPAISYPGMTFTNNNLTVSNPGTDVQYTTALASKAVTGNTNTKIYWEVSVNAFVEPASAVSFIGIASRAFIAEIEMFNGWLGEFNNGVGWRMGVADGSLVLNNAFTQVATYAQGNILEIAIDTGAQLIWVRPSSSANWNNNPSANPATGAGGYSYSTITPDTYYPAIQFDTSTTYQATANFGDAPFNGTVPSGFVSLADA